MVGCEETVKLSFGGGGGGGEEASLVPGHENTPNFWRTDNKLISLLSISVNTPFLTHLG